MKVPFTRLLCKSVAAIMLHCCSKLLVFTFQ